MVTLASVGCALAGAHVVSLLEKSESAAETEDAFAMVKLVVLLKKAFLKGLHRTTSKLLQ